MTRTEAHTQPVFHVGDTIVVKVRKCDWLLRVQSVTADGRQAVATHSKTCLAYDVSLTPFNDLTIARNGRTVARFCRNWYAGQPGHFTCQGI